ncbi:MAG TPA: hypothetical protein VFF13_02645 [archaeon]|nr:hypothetical protein [archaeon]
MHQKGKGGFEEKHTALPHRKAENLVRVYGTESGRIRELKIALASLKAKLGSATKYSKRMELRLLMVQVRRKIMESNLKILAEAEKLEGHYIPQVTLAKQIDRIKKTSKKELKEQAEELAKHFEKIREN